MYQPGGVRAVLGQRLQQPGMQTAGPLGLDGAEYREACELVPEPDRFALHIEDSASRRLLEGRLRRFQYRFNQPRLRSSR